MITSRDNEQIRAAKRLLQRKERIEQKAMVIEGARLVGDAFHAGFVPYVLFLQPESLRPGSPAHALIAEMEAAGVEIEECTAQVFAEISETMTPQGIAAVIPLPALPLPAESTLLLALDGVRDPGNAGTLLRSAEAVGAQGVIFGPGTVDPFNGKVVRGAMGAHFHLPIVEVEDWAEAQAFAPGATWYLADAAATVAYDEVDWTQPVVLVVGAEATGAGESVRARSRTVTIPMTGRADSLNAAMAGSILLFEAARQRRHKTIS